MLSSFHDLSSQDDCTAHYELKSIITGHLIQSVDIVLPTRTIVPLLSENISDM